MLMFESESDDLLQRILSEDTQELTVSNSAGGTQNLQSYSDESQNGAEFQSRIYYGDNYELLKKLAKDEGLAGEITLTYIDPPYAADHSFESRGGGRNDPMYRDSFEDAEYIEFMRERLILIHHLLSEDGSLYLHIGEEMLAHVKLLLDDIFGRDNYQNIISRKKCHSKNSTKKRYGNVQDFVLFYSKSEDKTWERPVRPPTKEEKERAMKEYRYEEEETGRKYMLVPLHAPGERDGETGEPWNSIDPPEGKHWTYPPEKLEEMDENGKIVWSKNGNPRKKVYYDNREGVPVTDMWTDVRDYYNQQQAITGYPTEKNVDLLKRIVDASSEEGDIVLDAFAGSGTTLAAADQLNRNWIGIDKGDDAIEIMQERLQSESGHSPFTTYSLN